MNNIKNAVDKIIFLDSATVDYGDIDFSPIRKLGDFSAFGFTPPEKAPGRARDAAIIILNKFRLEPALFDELPELRLIAVAATGYNTVDIAEAERREVAVANVPAYSAYSVAQSAMTFILACATNLIRYNGAAHDGRWSSSPVFTLGSWPTFEVRGKVLGILGLGDIGKQVARMAEAMGMRVAALRRQGIAYDNGIERLGLLELAEQSDFISVHMPLTEETDHLLDDEFFGRMKSSAFFLNLSRGPIVVSAALDRALRSGKIAGAAIDVMEQEPPDLNDPLLTAPNLIITPHMAWASIESRRRLVDEVAENIAVFQRGERRNRVDNPCR